MILPLDVEVIEVLPRALRVKLKNGFGDPEVMLSLASLPDAASAIGLRLAAEGHGLTIRQERLVGETFRTTDCPRCHDIIQVDGDHSDSCGLPRGGRS